MKQLIWRCMLLVLITCNLGFAQEVKELYTGYIQVKNKSKEQRKQAIPKLFEQVLVKVSGNTDVLNYTGEQNPEKFIDQISYIELPTHNGHKLITQAKFNRRAINQLLRSSNQAVWRSDRPVTIIWLATDSNEGKQLIGADSDSKLPNAINVQAKLHGLPVILPLLDLEDLNQVSADDVWAPFPWVVQKASKRYHAETQLMGKIVRTNSGEYKSYWTLLIDGAKINWESQGKNLEVLVDRSLTTVAKNLADRYAVRTTDGKNKQVNLSVSGIDGVGGFAKVSSYLKRLDAITQLEVKSIHNDQVIFMLNVTGGETTLTHLFATDQVLEPVDARAKLSNGQSNTRINLSYKLAT